MAASRKTSNCSTFTTNNEDLLTSESRGYFSCLLCLQQSFSSRPQCLDCRHMFCERCLQTHHRLYTINLGANGQPKSPGCSLVHCPTCRQVTYMSSAKSNTFSSPATHPNASAITTGNGSHHADARKISLATDALNQRCDACLARHRVEVADFYCAKCSLNMCNGCKLVHDHQALFSNHSVIHISNKDTVSLGCEIHGGRYACIYYCYDCSTPACTVCLLSDHGPSVTSLPGRTPGSTSLPRTPHRTAKLRDALAGRRDALKTLLNDFGPRLDRLEIRVKRLSSCSNPGSGLSGSTGLRSHLFQANGLGSVNSTHNNQTSNLMMMAKHRQMIGSKQDEDEVDETEADDDHDEVEEGDSSQQHAVQFFIINSVSRDDDENHDDDECFDMTEFDSLNRHSTSDLIEDQLFQLRRLFELSTRLLELSQSRRLLAVHREVTQRLQTVLDIELPLLSTTVNEMLDAESTMLSYRSLSPVNPGSNSSFSSGGNGNDTRTRHSSGLSGMSALSGNSGVTATLIRSRDAPHCPLSFLVRPKLVWKFEKQRNNDVMGEMWNPCGLAFFQNDQRLAVAEYDMTTPRNNKLRIFDSSGKTLATLLQGQIQPLGVAITRDGNIAVTDCIGKRVKILSSTTGQLITDIGKGQFGWPYGIVVNSHGQLVVTDAFNDSVSIYNQLDGKRTRQFGSSGTRDTNFRNPYHVTVDARDNILVSDCGNDCVKAFNSTGSQFLFRCDITTNNAPSLMSLVSVERTRSHRHRPGGRLRGPRGVCVDLRGNILVTDDCSRVSVFDGAGRYVRNLLTDEDLVKFPEAIQCGSSSGLMALTEWNPSSMFAVKVFTLYE